MNKKDITWRIFGASSGLMLTIPHIWSVLAPLQFAAMLPVLYLASRKDTTYHKMLYTGVYIGVFYVLPQAYVLRMPFIITLILFCEFILLFTVFSLLCYRLFRRPTLLSAFVVGALFVVLDWANFTFVPIWGMAQSIVRPWSAYPKLISFISITGLTGIVFLLATLQGLVVNLIVCPQRKIRYISSAVILIIVFTVANLALQSRKPIDSIKVSAIGWADNSSEISYPVDTNSLYARLVKTAAKENSKIVVSPELGFYGGSGDISQWLFNFQEIAKDNDITLVIGVDCDKFNKAIIIEPNGRISGNYTKTHLTPFEDFQKGDGKPVIASINGKNIGVMICHDDNFTDLSRSYGQKEASIVAVPTWDWSQVKNAHLQSSISRAIESNYTVVRACHNGISAIISQKGELIKKLDHLTEGSGIITAEVPLYSGKTLFSILGHWPVVPCLMLLLIYVAEEIRSQSSYIKQIHRP